MGDPEFLKDDQAAEVDTLIGADGLGRFKAAGRDIAATGISDSTAPAFVEDATLLTGTGHQAIAAGPVRTKLLAASTPCVRITVKADVANTHILYLGLSNVTADTTNGTGGLQLSAGESFTFGVDDVSHVYIHGTVAEGASFAYEL